MVSKRTVSIEFLGVTTEAMSREMVEMLHDADKLIRYSKMTVGRVKDALMDIDTLLSQNPSDQELAEINRCEKQMWSTLEKTKRLKEDADLASEIISALVECVEESKEDK